MAKTKLNVRLQLRSDTLANWEASTVVLLAGEFAYATDVKKFKIGDGKSTWSELEYVSADWDSIKPVNGIPATDLAAAVQSSLELADTALQAADVVITEGTTDGTISVKVGGTAAVEVAVHGLGSAAYTDSTAYEAAGAVAAHNTSEDAHADIRADITTNADAIATINSKIPTEATSTNQLWDQKSIKDFVNSSLASQAARFITATNEPEGSNVFSSFEALTEGPWYYDNKELTKAELTQNDYAVYLEAKEGGVDEQWRALFVKPDGEEGSWEEQYKIGSALTAAEQAAIESGITAAKVAQITTNTNNITANTTAISKNTTDIQTNTNAIADLETTVAGKQDTIEDVTDTAVAGKYVSSVSQKDGQIVVTREDLPTVTIPVASVEGVENNSVEVSTTGNVVTVQHKAYSTGNIAVTANTPYFINSVHVTEGHLDSATAQSLSDALTALGTLTLNGGNAADTI